MNHYIITGTSRGLGRAIAEEALNTGATVIGIARSGAIDHKNYTHKSLDIGNISLLLASIPVLFPQIPDARKIILINNAGTLGKVGKLGELNSAEIENVYSVNLTAPAILINAFLSAYRAILGKKIIVNVSSGAANNPSDGWSGYCATKAGLAMLTLVVAKEEQLRTNNYSIYSFDPGVMDTEMQSELRSVSERDFSKVQQYHALKEQNLLAEPHVVAKKIISVVEHPERFPETNISVRNVS